MSCRALGENKKGAHAPFLFSPKKMPGITERNGEEDKLGESRRVEGRRVAGLGARGAASVWATGLGNESVGEKRRGRGEAGAVSAPHPRAFIERRIPEAAG